MKYYLDTNTIIYAIKNTYPNIRNHIFNIPSYSIAIPSIVVAEIEYGARKSNNYEKTIEKYKTFIDTFTIKHFDNNASKIYGVVRSELEKTGKTIGPNDMIIASIVLSEDGVLVTHNVKEFERIKGLRIEDWTM